MSFSGPAEDSFDTTGLPLHLFTSLCSCRSALLAEQQQRALRAITNSLALLFVGFTHGDILEIE